VWPLLALLASAADEPARAELAAALARPADSAQRDALELLDFLRAGLSTTAAMGIWTPKILRCTRIGHLSYLRVWWGS